MRAAWFFVALALTAAPSVAQEPQKEGRIWRGTLGETAITACFFEQDARAGIYYADAALEPIRLEPRSYFWICWKVRPTAVPSFSWLMPSIVRRSLIRDPTCTSMALGDFFTVFAPTVSLMKTSLREIFCRRNSVLRSIP